MGAECTSCGQELAGESTEYNDDVYCADCWENNFSLCEDCDEVVPNDDLEYVAGRSVAVCSGCTEQYGSCINCNESYHENNLEEHNGESYCEDCHNNAHDDEKVIKDYEYKPVPVFSPTPNPSTAEHLYLGIELEIEVVISADRNEIAEEVQRLQGRVYCKKDGSLDKGFEIVSHPATLGYHLSDMRWAEILAYLREQDCSSHNTTTCGLHIHINRDYLTIQEQIKLAIFIHTQAKNITKIARRDSSYAKYKDGIEKLSDEEKISNGDRYEALNFQNRSTVEFRMFRGTLNAETFFATLEFVDSVVEFVKTASTADLASDIPEAWRKYIGYLSGKDYQYLNAYLTKKELL